MTPQEFKAWFEGYSEGVEDRPTKKQWERIQARVAEIDGKPTTHTVWVDRYWPWQKPWWQENNLPRWSVASQAMQSTGARDNATMLWNGPSCGAVYSSNAQMSGATAKASQFLLPTTQSFDAGQAFNALGRADALADAA